MTREEAIQTTVKALEGIPGTSRIIQELIKKPTKKYYKVRIPERIFENVNKTYMLKDYNMIYGERIIHDLCNQEYIVITENHYVAGRICGHYGEFMSTIEEFEE